MCTAVFRKLGIQEQDVNMPEDLDSEENYVDDFKESNVPLIYRRSGNASRKNSKLLNLSTYKWHALGDYVCAIRLFGPTDGFSTQVVSNLFLCN